MLYFIVNEKSRTGKGAIIWSEVKAMLKDRGIKYKACRTEYMGHATELAGQISKLKDDDIRLVVIGGDGTINEVINGITDFDKIRFGVIPIGSGNDFARGLNLKSSVEENLNLILSSTEDDVIDLGLVSWNGCDKPRYFAISAGVGFDAIVCKKALTSKIKKVLNRLHLGNLTYLILAVQTLFTMKTAKASAEYEGIEQCELNDGYIEIRDTKNKCYDKMIFSAAMNFVTEGGGIPMAPKANPRDGRLSMCIAHGISKWRTFFVLPFLVLGKHEKFKCFNITNFKKCKLHMDKPIVLHADGEYCGDVTDVHFECAAKKLKIMK